MSTDIFDTVKVRTLACHVCGEASIISVLKADYDRWVAGDMAQVAFPEMDYRQRETLISGTHPECWDKLFGGDDE